MAADTSPLLSGPHRRYNPLLDEWVLVSPHRLSRPWQGQVEPDPPGDLPAFDPACYLCPGNARAGGQRNPAYTSTYAFDNDFPALVSESPPTGAGEAPGTPPLEVARGALSAVERAGSSRAPDKGSRSVFGRDLLVAVPQRGFCRVLCFSPRHDLALSRMDVSGIRSVVELWADEVDRAARPGWVGYAQLFENRGAAMGCSNPHPHGQMWASEDVPQIPAKKLASQERYLGAHGRDLLGDYLARELDEGLRVVSANDAWAVVVPFWAVWPFEVMVVPRRRVGDLRQLTSDERGALAEILRDITMRYDNLFGCAFPYSMGWHGAALDGREAPGCRLHAVFHPPLLRSSTVRKFLVGYEMSAEPQRDLTAEQAAERLRAVPGVHCLDHLTTTTPA